MAATLAKAPAVEKGEAAVFVPGRKDGHTLGQKKLTAN